MKNELKKELVWLISNYNYIDIVNELESIVDEIQPQTEIDIRKTIF